MKREEPELPGDAHKDGQGDASADVIRPAATVILLRDAQPTEPERAQGDLEVLLLRRRPELAFYGGAWVFPGGRIEPEEERAAGGDLDRAARLAAIRETREEAGLTLRPDALTYFARWVTPPGRSRRFDTWYFAGRAPRGAIEIDHAEMDAHRWFRPQAALDARDAGEIALPPPTFVTLWQLAAFRDADEAFASLSAADVVHYVPRPTPVEGGQVFLYREDAGYADRNPDAPGPRHRITAVGPRWRYERS